MGRLPPELDGRDVAGVAVDREDHVFVYSRSTLPIVVLDREGTFVRGWGKGEFVRPHGIHVGADGTLWCVDDEGQRLVRYTLAGERLEVIARENRAAETGYVVGDARSVRHATDPFCYPTGVASGKSGDIWVTDGYGNARLHHFDERRDSDSFVRATGERTGRVCNSSRCSAPPQRELVGMRSRERAGPDPRPFRENGRGMVGGTLPEQYRDTRPRPILCGRTGEHYSRSSAGDESGRRCFVRKGDVSQRLGVAVSGNIASTWCRARHLVRASRNCRRFAGRHIRCSSEDGLQ